MISSSEREYYARRAREESDLAARAADPAAKLAHRQMAAEYRARAAGFGAPGVETAGRDKPLTSHPSQAH